MCIRDRAKGEPRSHFATLINHMIELGIDRIEEQRQTAEIAFFQLGVTFNVYSDNRGVEKIFPFDIIPRIIDCGEWNRLELGLKQRIRALNLFLNDVYNDQKIIKDGKIPLEVIYTASGFLKPCLGIAPPAGVWCHITGSDLVRDHDGEWYVLEDNLRSPSGVSYVLENRRVMKSTFPEIFKDMSCLLYTSPSPRDLSTSRMPSSA